ncbi:MAG TPA: hypothetical protein VHL78_01020 [Actinomycetota bacterium]|nr:hypothetical protein [Actinomycetota bacterium]
MRRRSAILALIVGLAAALLAWGVVRALGARPPTPIDPVILEVSDDRPSGRNERDDGKAERGDGGPRATAPAGGGGAQPAPPPPPAPAGERDAGGDDDDDAAEDDTGAGDDGGDG